MVAKAGEELHDDRAVACLRMRSTEYLADFRAGWRPLAAASLGMGVGLGLMPFVMNILAPHLIGAMGWSKSDFAMASVASGLTILAYPCAGRLADRFGARPVAGIGILALAASYAAIGALDGPIAHYVVILILQLTLGTMLSGPVLLRLIVQRFERSRGVALAITVSTPAIVAALASPLLSALIAERGWRVGSFAIAGFVMAVGALALLLIPIEEAATGVLPADDEMAALRCPSRGSLLAQPKFLLLMAITVLVSMPLVLTNSQLALILMDNGLGANAAGSVIGLFAAGTIAGRFLAGAALDRFPAEVVGSVLLSLPAVGMLLLASPFDDTMILACALAIIGFAFGAEGDVLAYVAARHFELDNYGTVLGLLFGAAGAAGMIGALILSQTLQTRYGYDAFLIFGSASVLVGSLMLLGLRLSETEGVSR